MSPNSSSPNLEIFNNLECFDNFANFQQQPLHEIFDRPCQVFASGQSSIFLGSLNDATDPKKCYDNKITKVLTLMCSDLPVESRRIFKTTKFVAIGDTVGANIIDTFDECSAFLDDCLKTPGNTLVHCHAGISRSATVCIAFLMARQRIKFEEAFDRVKACRPQVGPNFGFLGQLQTFERQLEMSRKFLPFGCKIELTSGFKAPFYGVSDKYENDMRCQLHRFSCEDISAM